MANVTVAPIITPVRVTVVQSSEPVRVAARDMPTVRVAALFNGPPGRPGLDGTATLGDIDLGTFN
jgi:hypothetical protein